MERGGKGGVSGEVVSMMRGDEEAIPSKGQQDRGRGGEYHDMTGI